MENLELCKSCKGSCCRAMGCHYSPEDFTDLSFEGLKKEIEKGYISIDYWEGNPFEDNRDIRQAYYLRIKHINSNIVDASWGGVCCLLTDSGCSLTYDCRPKGGRLLIPSKDYNCIPEYTKQQSAMDWYVYNDVLEKLVNYFSSKKENINSIGEKNIDSIIDNLFKNLSFMYESVGRDDINKIKNILNPKN